MNGMIASGNKLDRAKDIGLRDALAWWLWCHTALRIKHKILAINPPHESRPIINSLSELLIRVALRELSCVLLTNDVRDAANNLRESSVEFCALCH
jgi:hypothetical protein